VGHCGLGAGYVARYAAVVFRVSRYVYVSVDVAVRDCATVCTGRPNLERTQCTTLHIAAAWCETGPTRTPTRYSRGRVPVSPRPMVDPNGSR
jgi:hypothetical protein